MSEVNAYEELYKFCDEFDFIVELDLGRTYTPDNPRLILRVLNDKEKILGYKGLPNIMHLQQASSDLLNQLSK